jgi:hypothetical protein
VSGVLRWEDPPPPSPPGRRPTTAWSEVAAELRARPHTWALVYSGTYAGLANRIKQGESGFAPAGAFEVTTRGKAPQLVYVRYIGDPE